MAVAQYTWYYLWDWMLTLGFGRNVCLVHHGHVGLTSHHWRGVPHMSIASTTRMTSAIW